jgi:hypothetical protein
MKAFAFTCLLAVNALAKPPSAAEVGTRFKPATLPFTSDAAPAPRVELQGDEVVALGFSKSTSPELELLRQWKPEPSDDRSMSLWPLARIERPGVTALVVRLNEEGPAGESMTTFVLTYAKGVFIDGARLDQRLSGEGGGEVLTGTLGADGTVLRRRLLTPVMQEEGLPERLVVTSEQTLTLASNGTFTRGPERFTTKSGAFIDRSTKEELRVFDQVVFYRGNETKPFQRLLSDQDTVRFKAGGKPYTLTWDERKASISCRNPDGTRQTFTREW